MFNGGKDLPVGNFTDKCSRSDFLPCPSEKASMVFQMNQRKSRFGSDLTMVYNHHNVSSFYILNHILCLLIPF